MGAAGPGGAVAGAEPGASPSTGQLFRRLFPLYFTHIQQGILTTLPFTLAVYMVRDFESANGGTPSEATVGKLTGLLAAVFCAAQLVTSYMWGMISDRIGRKPVLVIGNISCVMGVLAFGLSRSYAQAIASRAVGGAFNAIILAEKAILGEGVPRASQAKGFGLLSLCWGLGSLAGPFIGGSLSAPCTTALRVGALCTEGSLLAQRPYFLPCLLAGVLSAAATVMTITHLEETLPRWQRVARQHGSSGSGGSAGKARYEQVPASDEAEEAAAPAGAAPRSVTASSRVELELSLLPSPSDSGSHGGIGSLQKECRGGEEGQDGSRPFRGDSARMSAGYASGGLTPGRMWRQERDGRESAEEDGGFGGAELRTSSVGGTEVEPGDKNKPAASGERKGQHGLLDSPASRAAAGTAGQVAAAVSVTARAAGSGLEAQPADASLLPLLPWYKQRSVLLSLLGYGLIAFLFNILDEVTPIFASAAVSAGGLGFSPSQLAPSLSFGGTVLVVWALYGFPWLSRRMGVVHALRLGLWHTAPLALLTPCASLFHGKQLPSQALMFVSMGFKAVAGTNAFTSCLIIVNAAAPPGSLGAVNGAGQSLASLVRAAGPALGGLTWAWSLQLAELRWWPAWLAHQYLPFALVALLALGTDLVYWNFSMPEAEEVVGSGGVQGGGSGSRAEV